MIHRLEQSSGKNARAALTLDRYTLIHSHGVARLAQQLGVAIGYTDDQVSELKLAGKLHDLGKVAIPSELLLKPGPLSKSDWQLMQAHAETGAWLADTLGAPPRVVEAIRQHHERLDGSGYPAGLAGAGIGEYAKILAVVDVYSAMTQARPYRGALPRKAAFDYLRTESLFDSAVVNALEALIEGVGHGSAGYHRLRLRRSSSVTSAGK